MCLERMKLQASGHPFIFPWPSPSTSLAQKRLSQALTLLWLLAACKKVHGVLSCCQGLLTTNCTFRTWPSCQGSLVSAVIA